MEMGGGDAGLLQHQLLYFAKGERTLGSTRLLRGFSLNTPLLLDGLLSPTMSRWVHDGAK